jgi:hypothetical protein
MCQQIPLWERLADGVKDQPLVEERQTRPVAPLTRRPQRVVPGRPSPATPRWPTLAVIFTVGIGLVAVTDVLMPVGAWRTITGCLAVILMFSSAAGWVRANRSALRRIDECGCGRPSLEIRYVASDRYPLWSADGSSRIGSPRRPSALTPLSRGRSPFSQRRRVSSAALGASRGEPRSDRPGPASGGKNDV